MKSIYHEKFMRKLNSKIVSKTRNKKWYPLIYKSYWHSIFHKNKNFNHSNTKNHYFSAKPNPGAGIGHQMANWIAGYWFAKQFHLKFAHLPFSTKWDDFLGFGNEEITVKKLIDKKYKSVKLPLFDENNKENILMIKKIINSYNNKQVIFITEQDQSYKNQFGVIKDIKKKFYNTNARKNNQLIYLKKNYNIAIHIRRGDIMKDVTNLNHQMRIQKNQYFYNIIKKLINSVKFNKKAVIHIFSQGNIKDFPEFNKFENVKFHLNMSPMNSFLHMVYADLLITSKSSFSYKPALLSNGIKICPKKFWHGYPKEFILTDEKGNFNLNKFKKTLNKQI